MARFWEMSMGMIFFPIDTFPKNEENITMGDIKKQAKHSKIRGYIHDFGKFFIDISKLAFGSLVLGTIIR